MRQKFMRQKFIRQTKVYTSDESLYVRRKFIRQEDVKKLISWSFRDFIFDPKCLPTSQRSLKRHPSAIFLNAQFIANFKIDFFTASCPGKGLSRKRSKMASRTIHLAPRRASKEDARIRLNSH